MNSKESAPSSRSSHRASPRSRAAGAKRSHVALTKHASSSKPSQAGREAAPSVPLAKRVLQKMKTKTGLAVAAGAVLAGLGLARKLRAAH